VELCEKLSLDCEAIAEFGGTMSDEALEEQPLTQESTQQSISAPQNRADWGEAVDVSLFYGRVEERKLLTDWIVMDRCRFITLVGMGGIGKTSLSVKLAEQVQGEFEYLIWRSLRNAPPVMELLADLIQFLSHQQATLPDHLDGRVSRLLDLLRTSRCLLVLDNAEVILGSGDRAGVYREGYEGYSHFFKCVGETRHQSCFIVTSREKLRSLSPQEGKTLPVRSLRLMGLEQAEGQSILQEKGFAVSEAEVRVLVEHYAGNPLALKIVATTIQELFDGDPAQFLEQGITIFGDISDLLDQQFDRLSGLEKQVMYWLTIQREWMMLPELQEDVVPFVQKRTLIEAVESLQVRSLIEKKAASFTQQPVVMEYVTDQLIEQVFEEIIEGQIVLFNSHALIKAQTKDYLRNAQTNLILQPVANRLSARLGSRAGIRDRLQQILATLRTYPPRQPGYAAGNLLNLLRYLELDFRDFNFSGLTVWQAYLQGVNLQGVNLAEADLTRSVFTQMLGGISSAMFSPDSRLLATGIGNELCLWQVPECRQIDILQGHTDLVQAVAFSVDGQLVASGSRDQTLRIWQVETGQCLKTLRGHTDEVRSIAFSPDGNLLASGSYDQTVRVWDVSTWECLSILADHHRRVLAVLFSPIDQMLISSDDQTVRLWNPDTRECLRHIETNINWVLSIALSPDGKTLAVGADHSVVQFWNIATGQLIKTLPSTHLVWSIAFSPDGKVLATASEDRTVRIWDVLTGECLRTCQEHQDRVWLVAFSPDGRSWVSISEDQTIKLWDASGQCLRTLDGYNNWIFAVAFSPDGRWLASGSEDQVIRLWDVEEKTQVRTLQGHTNIVGSVAFAPQHPPQESIPFLKGQLLASSSDDQTIRLWDSQTGECLKTLRGHQDWIQSVRFSADGQLLASGSRDQTIKLWDWRTGECLQTLQGHTERIKSIAFHPRGLWLASGSDDQAIRLWEVATGLCVRVMQGHQGWVMSVAFSPEGDLLASGSADQMIKIWDMKTGHCLRTLTGHHQRVVSVAFSPNGQYLASGGSDCTVRLWAAKTGVLLKTFTGHTRPVWSVAFHPVTAVLASGSEDETINLWNIETGDCIKTFKIDRPYQGMSIQGAVGLTPSQRITLQALGAVEIQRF
jgi:WD40 repeat protein